MGRANGGDKEKRAGRGRKPLGSKDRAAGREEKRKIVLKRRPCPIRGTEFSDATKIEKELLAHGTTKDKIDALTLVVERNPSVENYKSLLAFCENQRNDVHYYALKNIKDLMLSKKGPGNSYIKQRIVKSFDVNMRNQYIKRKVAELVYKLLEERVLFVDLIHLFVNKLGDKKDMSDYVAGKLHTLFPGNEEMILDGVEDFYFKNDSFRSRHVTLRFLAGLECENKDKAFEVFNSILQGFNESIPEEHRNILLEDLITGLAKNMAGGEKEISKAEVVRRAVHTEKMVFYGAKVLLGSKDPETLSFMKSAIKSHKMRESKDLPEFLNMVHEVALMHRDPEFCRFLLDTSLLYTPEYIMSILVICSGAREAGMSGFDNVYCLRLLALHHNDVVRRFALQLISGEEVLPFDPFDKMSLLSAEMMCADL